MAMQWLKAAENLLESVDRQAKSAAVPRWDSPRDGGEISSGSEGKAFNKAQVILNVRALHAFVNICDVVLHPSHGETVAPWQRTPSHLQGRQRL